MADITIETSAYFTLHSAANRGGIFWTTPLIGYVIYIQQAGGAQVYRKTTDGGANWGEPVVISQESEVIRLYDCWADWQTPGDSGTKIHVVYLNADEDEVIYRYLDTSTDTVGDRIAIRSYGSGTWSPSVTKEYHSCSITKGKGGKLAIAYRVVNVADDGELEGFYTSSDGVTWASKTIPFETAKDYIQLYCGNEADTDDLWAAFWDKSADEISLKTYDDSGNSWSEQSIASSMADSNTYLQMDGQIRLSDGHLIFAAWDAYGFAGTANLKVWDINGSGSITAKDNVIDDTQHYFNVSVFINQLNDDIYVAYIGGTAILSQVAAVYKKSTDGGTSWGSQTAMQADAEDDERWISAGCMKSSGKFMPVWFNDDLDDIFCNFDNAIIIISTIVTITGPRILKEDGDLLLKEDGDALLLEFGQWELEIDETENMSDTLAKAVGLSKSDTFNITDALGKAFGLIKSESVAIADSIIKAVSLNKADIVTLTDGIAKALSAVKAETLTISDGIVKAFGKARTDTLAISDSILKAIGVNKTDTVNISDAIVKAVSLVKSDTVNLADALRKAISLVKAETLNIVDVCAPVIGAIAHVLNLFDTVTISDSLVGVIRIWTRLKISISPLGVKGMDIARMGIKRMNISKTPLYRWITRRWTA